MSGISHKLSLLEPDLLAVLVTPALFVTPAQAGAYVHSHHTKDIIVFLRKDINLQCWNHGGVNLLVAAFHRISYPNYRSLLSS